jgi:gliding motility-associated lipoprotein GldD
MKFKRTSLVICLLILFACADEQYIPKPPTYLRLELPDHSYELYNEECPFTFEKAKPFKIKPMHKDQESCSKQIDLGPLNGTIYMHYWKIEKPLSYYINTANDEVDRHKIKATSIDDKRILRTNDRVFGTFFQLHGDVATPFQYYLTDSINQFVYCEVLFNSTPNYDSLKPSIDYLSKDIEQMINTFKWK